MFLFVFVFGFNFLGVFYRPLHQELQWSGKVDGKLRLGELDSRAVVFVFVFVFVPVFVFVFLFVFVIVFYFIVVFYRPPHQELQWSG